MNKIIVNDDKVKINTDKNIDVDLTVKQDIFDITRIKIQVLKDTKLMIEYKSDNKTKIDIEINVDKDVNFKLYELREENDIKVQYRYELNEYSNVLVNKFYDCNKVKELDVIYLNGENAEINYNFNSIAKDKQDIDLVVYHNHHNTISNLNNKAVNILNGSTTFNITGSVYNTIKDCVINQNNRIINLNNKKSTINPILLIDENDVEANHAALIGKFSKEEIFYLMSRGIDYDTAINLLVKGFLYIDLLDDDRINKIIDKYWR